MIVLGIMGDERVSRSKSPLMHSVVMRRLGMDGVYVPFAVSPERVVDAMRGIRALGILGVNVTVPHKQAVIPHMDELSDEASDAGAVNTIVNSAGRLNGHNTDIGGFMDALSMEGFPVSGRSVLVVGAGGAARAVLVGIRRLGVGSIWVAGRDMTRVRELAQPHGAEPILLDQIHDIAGRVEILINATSVSSSDEGPELSALVGRLHLPHCSHVVDVNYGREENFWGRLAKAIGAHFMAGVPLLAYQAARSFALWTGIEVCPEEYLDALRGNP